MLQYVSNKGGGKAVDFETAILDGFASDGGLYVPESLPKLSQEQLQAWKDLDYLSLAYEILSLFIDRSILTEKELQDLLKTSYSSFEKENIIPIKELPSRHGTYIMELFYGPTLSFKDVGLAFLVNLVDFFLQRKQERLSIIVATTGDTGPAAAYFTAGKTNLDAWVLYPRDKITEAQERQMTTLPHPNIHAVGVSNCPDGGDDLDLVIHKLYANKAFKEKLKLSSVNSINWGRIMMQTVHYFYGYFQLADTLEERINVTVPSGGFGNLCAGGLARKMGLPIKSLVVANNKNACLHRIFSKGVFSKKEIHETISSAIDILIPYNFWRYLFFCTDDAASKINIWQLALEKNGVLHFDRETHKSFSEGFLSQTVSDTRTKKTLKKVFEEHNYLLDPHGAVSLAAADSLRKQLGENKLICMTTAHPAKFPEVIQDALSLQQLPELAMHPSIEDAKRRSQKVHLIDHAHLEEALIYAMEKNWDLTKRV